MSSAAATLETPAPHLSNSHNRDALAVAHSHLIRRLIELRLPRAAAIGEVPHLIREVANICDEWLFAIGQHVGDRVSGDVDIRVFQGAFLGAVDGNATYEIESVLNEAGRYRTLRRAL